jgi:V8-like Glu-specific endopeptidase
MSVRLRQEPNAAYDDQPKPMEAEQALEEIQPLEPERSMEDLALELSIPLAGDQEPKVESEVRRLGEEDPVLSLDLTLRGARLGEHAFGAPTKAVELEFLGDRGNREPLVSEGVRPEHLALNPRPDRLPKELQRPAFMERDLAEPVRERGNRATTVFAPENRSTLWSGAYPWSASGRVDTAGGFGSGVMVGPRHLLTCAHVIQWLPNNQTGWIRFRPRFFDGSAPFGDAWGVLTYYKAKVSGPTIDWWEGMYDYVCVVLNRRIGDVTGWVGSRGYTDSWDGGRYWTHVGYPGDLAGGNRPFWEGSIALDGAWWQFDSHEAMSHRGDVWPGQSGGPFWGWWSGFSGPHAVAVQSSHNPSENNASGGQDMADLVIRARADHP